MGSHLRPSQIRSLFGYTLRSDLSPFIDLRTSSPYVTQSPGVGHSRFPQLYVRLPICVAHCYGRAAPEDEEEIANIDIL